MRNLKKMLAVLLAVAIMLTAMVPAFAAGLSDVKGTEYEAAATRLNGLGIFTGKPDGNFAPNDTITRAEFAAVLVRALNYTQAADTAKGKTKFPDVKSDSWAAGYINIANEQKVINGRSDGTFAPDAKVTFEEAVTMVVRALGYEKRAQDKGGYPGGYLAVASETNILKDVTSPSGQPASRGMVAKMVDNALEVPLMVSTEYDRNGNPIYVEADGKNDHPYKDLLTFNLKLKKYTGIVDSVDTDKKKVKIKLDKQVDKNDDTNGTKAGRLETYTAIDTIALKDIDKTAVTAWVKENDTGATTNDGTIYALKLDSTVFYDVISKINGEDDKDKIKTKTEENLEDITLKIADTKYDVKTKENSSNKDVSDIILKYNNSDFGSSDTLDTLLKTFAKVYVRDAKIYRIDAYQTSYDGIISDVTDDAIKYTRFDTNGKSIGGIKDNDSLLVVIDNKAASYADLKKDMYFEAWNDNKDYVIAATTKQLTGKLESTKVDKVKINGTYTSTANNFKDGKKFVSLNAGKDFDKDVADDLYGKDVVAYLNLSGKVAYLRADTNAATTDFYGVVVKAWSSDENNIKVVKDVNGQSDVVPYKVKKDADLDTDDSLTLKDQNIYTSYTGTKVDIQINPVSAPAGYKLTKGAWDDLKTYASENIGSSDPVVAAAIKNGRGVYHFYVNKDGYVKKVKAVPLTEIPSATKFNKNDRTLENAGNSYYVDGSKFFNITKKDKSNPPAYTLEDVKVAYWDNLKDKSLANVGVLVSDSSKASPDVVVFSKGFDNIDTTDRFYAYVKNAARTGDYWDLELVTPDGTTTVQCKDDDIGGTADDTFIEYTKDGDKKIKVKGVVEGVYNHDNPGSFDSGIKTHDDDEMTTAVTDHVYDLDGSYIDITNNSSLTDGYHIDGNVLVYKIYGDKFDTFQPAGKEDIKKIKKGDPGDAVLLVLGGGSKKIVKAIFYVEKKK